MPSAAPRTGGQRAGSRAAWRVSQLRVEPAGERPGPDRQQTVGGGVPRGCNLLRVPGLPGPQLLVGCFVLGDDCGGNTTTLAHFVPVLAGPVPYLGTALTTRATASLATSARAGHPPSVVSECAYLLAKFLAVRLTDSVPSISPSCGRSQTTVTTVFCAMPVSLSLTTDYLSSLTYPSKSAADNSQSA
jgi:hypothetical protein